MKNLYSVVTLALIFTVVANLNAQNVSTIVTYSGVDEVENIESGARIYPIDPVIEEVQGYSHGIDYRSSSNSLNMMECVVVRGHDDHNATRQPTLTKPKYVTMSKVLSLSDQEAEAFFPVYARYESEIFNLMGTTPDVNKMSELQQVVKDKFFNEINRKSGSYLASRFLDWENYYSITCVIK